MESIDKIIGNITGIKNHGINHDPEAVGHIIHNVHDGIDVKNVSWNG